MVRLARAAVVVVALAACGGDGGGSSSSPPAAEPEPTTTTTPEAEIDLSRPIPAGSLHGTPRPPLENTGDDYVAIFESLTANFRWLTENPDPALVGDLYVPETEVYRVQSEVVGELSANAWRAADDGYRVVQVEVVGTSPELVTLRVTDAVHFEQIVDADGNRIGQGITHADQQKWTVILTPGPQGQWRIADWRSSEGGTVEL